MTITGIKELAKKYKWKPDTVNLEKSLMNFIKGDIVISVFYKKKTVETQIYHPKSKGWTTLIRPDYTDEMLVEVFKDPRAHTGKGYYATSDPCES